MSYATAQHTLTIAFNALATTPLLVAVVKLSIAVFFSSEPAAPAMLCDDQDDDTSWESIWASVDALGGATLVDDGIFAVDDDGVEYLLDIEPVAAPEEVKGSDYGAIVRSAFADSDELGLDSPCSVADWSQSFTSELMGRKKADLLATASGMGLRLSAKLNKATIVAAIVAAPAC